MKKNLNKISVYQIDEDGDLKFLFFLNTNVLPKIGETIAYLKFNDDNTGVREYYDVMNIVHPVTESDVSENVDFVGELVLHVRLTISEPIL